MHAFVKMGLVTEDYENDGFDLNDWNILLTEPPNAP